MQNAINEICKCEKSTGFKFGPAKSKSILFSYKKNIDSPQLYMDNILIPPTNDLKILGLNLNNQLNWSNHIKILKPNEKLRLNIISALSNWTWGANFNILWEHKKSDPIHNRLRCHYLYYLWSSSKFNTKLFKSNPPPRYPTEYGHLQIQPHPKHTMWSKYTPTRYKTQYAHLQNRT